MKYIAIAALSLFGTAFGARPSVATNESDLGIGCQFPRGSPRWSRWENFWWDSCCSGKQVTGTSNCECIHKGEFYWNKQGISDNCCSANAKTRTGLWRDKELMKCGCIETNIKPKMSGVRAQDCCSGQISDADDYKNARCVKADCIDAGDYASSYKPCCSGRTYTDEDGTTKCGCIHTGGKLDTKNKKVSASNCCSEQVQAKDKVTCLAIPDNKVLKNNASESDCSSGAVKKGSWPQICRESNCTAPGLGLSSKGSHCCAGTEPVNGSCGCVPAGKPLPKDTPVSTCCSGKQESGGNCSSISAGDSPNTDIGATPQDCSSRKVDSTGKCKCISSGTATNNQTQCCSGAARSGICKCISSGKPLHSGQQSDCCSNRESDGVCQCTLPGRPITLFGGEKDDCCGNPVGDICGCLQPGNATKDEQECCSLRVYNGTCQCIPSGAKVAEYVTEGACCNKKKRDNYTCGAILATKSS